MASVLLAVGSDFHFLVGAGLLVVFSLGLLATFAPQRFSAIAASGGRWVDTDKVRELLERPIDVDQHVLRYSRVFGVLVALASGWLAFVYWTHFVR